MRPSTALLPDSEHLRDVRAGEFEVPPQGKVLGIVADNDLSREASPGEAAVEVAQRDLRRLKPRDALEVMRYPSRRQRGALELKSDGAVRRAECTGAIGSCDQAAPAAGAALGSPNSIAETAATSTSSAAISPLTGERAR